jgi:cytochrome c oxidase subunit II
MDKYESRVMIAAALILTVFIFAIIYSTQKQSMDVPECIPYDGAYKTGKVEQLDSTTFRVFAVAKMWAFEPSEIYIPAGSEVDLYLTSNDVVHGMYVAGTNINLMAVYGAVNKTSMKFEKPGIYTIICHEYCGVGHQQMMGTIYVN